MVSITYAVLALAIAVVFHAAVISKAPPMIWYGLAAVGGAFIGCALSGPP